MGVLSITIDSDREWSFFLNEKETFSIVQVENAFDACFLIYAVQPIGPFEDLQRSESIDHWVLPGND